MVLRLKIVTRGSLRLELLAANNKSKMSLVLDAERLG